MSSGYTPRHMSAMATGTVWSTLNPNGCQASVPVAHLCLHAGQTRGQKGEFVPVSQCWHFNVYLYSTTWNTAELSLPFTSHECNWLLILNVSKTCWINLGKVLRWIVINHSEYTTLWVKFPLSLHCGEKLSLVPTSNGFPGTTGCFVQSHLIIMKHLNKQLSYLSVQYNWDRGCASAGQTLIPRLQ